MPLKNDWNSDPVLNSMREARDFRTERRENDRERDLAVSRGIVFPTADELLRGCPFFGADLGFDMVHFWALMRRDLIADGYEQICPELSRALDQAKETGGIEDVRSVARILAEYAEGEAGAFREERLRCRLYLGALGDTDAAFEVAIDALLAAYRQEWHMVGDGSLLVWRVLGWLAQAAATRSRVNLSSKPSIKPMSQPEVRVLSVADEFRTRVERCVLELSALGE